MAATGSTLRTFQMPSHGWGMVKRIVRAYGASQDDESGSVESVAKLAGIHRPMVSGNNSFLRAIGLVDAERPKLTPLGVNLATGLGLENESITTEALQEVVRTTPIFSQLVNTLRARGSMELAAFKGQVILAAGLKPNSPNLASIKTLTDLLEESKLIEIRDEKVFLASQSGQPDKGAMSANTVSKASETTAQTGQDKPTTVVPQIVEMLLSKFPEFDPAWSEDVKLKWFDAFDRLMKGRGL